MLPEEGGATQATPTQDAAYVGGGASTASFVEHKASTEAVRKLMCAGVRHVEEHRTHDSRHRLGTLGLRICANDTACGETLTRCLLPLASDPAHVEPDAVARDFVIYMLCGSSAPWQTPPAWNLAHTDHRHLERLHLCEHGTLSAFYDHDRRFWFILDHTARIGLFWLADAIDLPFWETAAPFKTLIHWFLHAEPMTMLHAGVVVDAGKALVLVGPGGSGKSTTVATWLSEGLAVCGDDLVLAAPSTTGWRAYALYDSIKLSADGALPIPARLGATPWWPSADKRVMRCSGIHPTAIAPAAAIAGLAQCVVTGKTETRIVAQPASNLLRALVPPTVFLLRGRETSTLKKLSALVRSSPCYRLELGTDRAALVATLRLWLQGAPA